MARNPVLEETSELFSAYCLKVLKQGGIRVQTGTTEAGHAVVELIDIPPAMLSAIERWLHHNGLSKATPAQVGAGSNTRSVADTVNRLRLTGKIRTGAPLGPVSEKRDAATG